MNERIKQLALQFGNRTGNSVLLNAEIFEEFAELIVRECAQYIEDKFDFCGDELIIDEKLKQYFGVE